MQCPICNREVADEAELMACITHHMQQEASKQAKDMQRVYMMMMASQLTVACTTTHTTPQEVVGIFKEVYGLVENIADKGNVSSEIDTWLKQQSTENEDER